MLAMETHISCMSDFKSDMQEGKKKWHSLACQGLKLDMQEKKGKTKEIRAFRS